MLIEYLPSLLSQPFQFYSCFISYSTKDRDFADRLYADLQIKGVRCWFAPEDLKIGDLLRQRIDDAIRLHDKLLLILSSHSVLIMMIIGACELQDHVLAESKQPARRGRISRRQNGRFVPSGA
jgi:hypothetical protein